jgi:hypothetical protein
MRPAQQGGLVEIASRWGSQVAHLIHQFNGQLVALDPDMDVQAADQDGAGDILPFLFQLCIALLGYTDGAPGRMPRLCLFFSRAAQGTHSTCR